MTLLMENKALDLAHAFLLSRLMSFSFTFTFLGETFPISLLCLADEG